MTETCRALTPYPDGFALWLLIHATIMGCLIMGIVVLCVRWVERRRTLKGTSHG